MIAMKPSPLRRAVFVVALRAPKAAGAIRLRAIAYRQNLARACELVNNTNP
jgi:hypothetical protein